MNALSNNLFSINRVRLLANNISKEDKKEWKSGKEGKEKQCTGDGVFVRNNTQEPIGGIGDKGPPPEIANNRLVSAKRDKKQPETADKRLTPATKDKDNQK